MRRRAFVASAGVGLLAGCSSRVPGMGTETESSARIHADAPTKHVYDTELFAQIPLSYAGDEPAGSFSMKIAAVEGDTVVSTGLVLVDFLPPDRNTVPWHPFDPPIDRFRVDSMSKYNGTRAVIDGIETVSTSIVSAEYSDSTSATFVLENTTNEPKTVDPYVAGHYTDAIISLESGGGGPSGVTLEPGQRFEGQSATFGERPVDDVTIYPLEPVER